MPLICIDSIIDKQIKIRTTYLSYLIYYLFVVDRPNWQASAFIRKAQKTEVHALAVSNNYIAVSDDGRYA